MTKLILKEQNNIRHENTSKTGVYWIKTVDRKFESKRKKSVQAAGPTKTTTYSEDIKLDEWFKIFFPKKSPIKVYNFSPR